MKRILSLLLALLLVLGLAACSFPDGNPGFQNPKLSSENPEAQPETSSAQEPAPESASEPSPTPPPFQTYVYEEGGLSIGVPWSLPAEPEKTDKGIVFADPEGEWTVRFEPLSVKDTPYRVNNTTADVQRMLDFGYYQDVQIEEIDLAGYAAKRLSFSRNPDWVEASMGYTALDYTEAHCILLVDYTDVVVANFGGLLIDVSAPEKTMSDIRPILEDPDVKILLENLEFAAPATEKTASIPGITVKVPIRWDVGDDGKTTLWASFRGDPKVTVFFTSSIYQDPREGASYIGSEVKTLDIGGRAWYAGVSHSQLSSSDTWQLEMLTDFTQFHALKVTASLYQGSEADHWAFAESDTLRGILESLELDPEAFQDPEKDRMDTSGFECNNVGEISAYTGSESEITIPAVIGQNEIAGVNTDVFKGNAELRSVTLQEGIRYIDYGAFRDCPNLETVVLPNSLTHVDSYAFSGCSSLREVRFGEGLLTIDTYAFENCSALGDVNLPASLVMVGENAFNGAGSGQGSFSAPAEGVVYGKNALARTHFDTVEFGPNADLSADWILGDAYVNRVVIGSGCQALGAAFMTSPIYNDEEGMWHYTADPVTVELNGVEKIGERAFQGRLGLTEIDLTGLTEMGSSAFDNTGLVNIVVPGSLKEIPESAFNCCPDVQTITLEEGVERVGAYAFQQCGRRYPDRWSLRYFTEEEAAEYGDRIVPNGSPDFDIAVTIYLPSTLQYADSWSFSCMFINGLYMLWCTEPDMLPDFHEEAFSACEYIHQFYFTQETIEQYGDELDRRLNELEDVGEPAWYYEGKEPYWAAEKIN
ncbi:MAG: leucine-rich repeat domain-containing protein [Oscillospiraceae bacterium]|nr:leucine-rich repeat domain-containing protein [Oscillospiraceae bacterium]